MTKPKKVTVTIKDDGNERVPTSCVVTFTFAYYRALREEDLLLSPVFYRKYRGFRNISPELPKLPHHEIEIVNIVAPDAFVQECVNRLKATLLEYYDALSEKSYVRYVDDIPSEEAVKDVTLLWSLSSFMSIFYEPECLPEFTGVRALSDAPALLEEIGSCLPASLTVDMTFHDEHEQAELSP